MVERSNLGTSIKAWYKDLLTAVWVCGCCRRVFRFPVVAMGVLKWVDWTVSEPRYFQLQTDHTPVHLALLDEVWHNYQTLSLVFVQVVKSAVKFKQEILLLADLYVPPAAAPTGPPAAHQALWDGALSAGRHGAGGCLWKLAYLHFTSTPKSLK